MNLDSLKLEDLYIECKECNGSGDYAGPPRDKGRGIDRHQIWETGKCLECNGEGGKFTKAGEVMLTFIQKAKRKGRI
jgi:hypothetical protein